MTDASPLAEVWRGGFLEARHAGHVAIVHAEDGLVFEWGDPRRMCLPRSSAKMIQALPLVESGAADAAGLGPEHLALACASHFAAETHTARVARWLDGIGLTDDALRCGAWPPRDAEAAAALIREGRTPCQWHNECSGKHAGFLTYARHVDAGAEYLEIDHPVQVAVREAFEDTTGAASPGWAIDGCSAPNFATRICDMASAMARFAAARETDARGRAMTRLCAAMTAFPELVAGETRACTELMRAMDGRAAIKTGAEGYFVAIVPERRLGVALKVDDGATRASECAMTAILAALGLVDTAHPAARRRLGAPVLSKRGLTAGRVDAAGPFLDALSRIA